MRKVTIYINISLDGVISGVEKWANINNDVLKDSIERYKAIDAVIFGGATYAEMAGYWQEAEVSSKSVLERELAKMLNDKPKIIISNKHIDLNWRNSELWLVKTNKTLTENLTKLKNEKGAT